MTVRIINADVFDGLKKLPDNSVHCVVTSPPYFGLRAYGGEDKMIGLETTLEEHIDKLLAVFREVRRVMRDDATLWLNYGDGYWGGKGQSNQAWSGENQDRDTLQRDHHHVARKGETRPTDMTHDLFKPKDLIMMPARLAIALHADEWWIRSEIVWSKGNNMPESVTDRPTCSHEKIFLLTKAPKYFYDGFAVRTKRTNESIARDFRARLTSPEGAPQNHTSLARPERQKQEGDHVPGANLRNVWNISTFSYPGNHYATFPPKLVETCIKAGTSENGVCSRCGAPSVREVKKSGGTTGRSWHNHDNDQTHGNRPGDRTIASAYETGEY